MFAEAHSRPPWASMIERQIESPMPMPPDLVVKKALNSRSAFSAEIPTPQSVTLTSTCCVSSWSDRITSSRGRTVTECMASMPFIHSLMADQLTLHQRDGLPHDVIDVERHLLKAGLVRERPDAPDHLTRPIAVVDNPFQRSARCVRVGSSAAEPAQTGLGVGDDTGERLVHFMGDRCRQFAQGCYARYVCELHLSIAEALFAGAQPFFRSLAVGHVDDKGNTFIWFPLEKRAGDQNRHAAAVFAKVLFLTRMEGSNRLELCDDLFVGVAPFGRRQLP